MNPARRRFLACAAALAASGAGRRPARAEGAAVPLVLRAAARPEAPGALSFDGSAMGPVVRIARGDTLAVSLTNDLAAPMALQWHGLRGPNAIDPAILAPLAPGQSLTQRLTPPDSGLFWFHAAALPGAPDQTAAGLRGVLIVAEEAPPVADRDILVMVTDGPASALLVNGGSTPLRDTLPPGGRCRLRLLNASTTRLLVLAVEGATPKVVAIDGQPSDLFAPARNAVPIGPGARFELMLDAPRETGAVVRLLSPAPVAGEGPRPPDTVLATLTTAGPAREALPPIAALPRNPALPPAIALEAAVRASLLIEEAAGAAPGTARWRLNGTAALALPASPLLRVPRGGVVTLGLDNRSRQPIPLRLHGHVMRLLHAKDDGWEPYWRDSVILPPLAVTHVAFLADNPGDWLLESAVADQAASGLRHWFRVAA